MQAVSNIIASLRTEGLLIKDGVVCHGRGLPATQYMLNPDGGFALGFEVSPRSVSVALLNITGELCFSLRQAVKSTEPAAVSRARGDRLRGRC